MSPSTSTSPPTSLTIHKSVTNASHPFNKATADAILRASDNVDFWVRRSILAEASCVFEDMLSLPQPAPGSLDCDEVKDGLPVIRLTEDSNTIDKLLRLCYPTDDPELNSLDELRPVLEAATKFMMQEATSLLRKRLVRLGQAQPLQAFATACSLGLDLEAEALAPLAHSVCGSFAEELYHISAGVYYRIAHYVPGTQSSSPKHQIQLLPPMLAPMVLQDPLLLPIAPAAELIPAELLNSSTADVILRSVDGVNFYLHSTILSMASPIFQQRIADHMETNGALGGPIILDEDSQTLATLLQHVYPLPRPAPPATIDTLKTLLTTAEKYQLRSALSALRPSLLSFLPANHRNSTDDHLNDALRVFALAHRFNLPAERTAAAHALLCLSNHELRTQYVVELEDISAAAYFSLLEYHDKCGQAASACVLGHALRYVGAAAPSSAPPSPISTSSPSTSGTRPSVRTPRSRTNSGAPIARRAHSTSPHTSPAPDATSHCQNPESPSQQPDPITALTSSRTHTYTCHVVLDDASAPAWAHFRTHSTPRWWIMYIYKLGFVLRRRPCVRAVALDRGLRRRAIARAIECECCRGVFLPGFEEYVGKIVAEVERAVSKVKLEVK